MLQSILLPTRGACMTTTKRPPGCFCMALAAVGSLVTSSGMSGATGAKAASSGTLRCVAMTAVAMRRAARMSRSRGSVTMHNFSSSQSDRYCPAQCPARLAR